MLESHSTTPLTPLWRDSLVATSKRMPSNLDAERAILASVMIDPEAMVKVAPTLEPEHFYSPKHQSIWAAMKSLFLKREPIDLVSVNTILRQEGGVEPEFTAGLFDLAPKTSNIVSYGKMVRDTRKLRALITASAEIAILAYGAKDADEVEITAKELILEAVGTGEMDEENVRITPTRQAEIIQNMFREMRKGNTGAISTGLPSLDTPLAGGMHREEVIIVAARTSVGKSAFAENMLEHTARKGGRVLNVQLEMSPEQVMERYLIRAGLPRDVVKGQRLPSPKEEDQIEELVRQREQWKVYLLNQPGVTVTGIHSEVSRLTLQEGQLDLVCIDYLQLMGDVNEDKMVTSIAKVTKRLKIVAREFHVPVILISQLNRNVEHRGGKPRLHDLAHSGSIENDSDVVLLLWDTPDDVDASGNYTHMYIAKNRQGPKELTVPIKYYGPTFRFRDAGVTSGQHQPIGGAEPEANQEDQERDSDDEGREESESVGEEVREGVRQEV